MWTHHERKPVFKRLSFVGPSTSGRAFIASSVGALVKCKNPSFVIFSKKQFAGINHIWSLVPINEDSFPNCQNLKPKMMQPKTSRLKTNLTGLKSTRKHSFTHLQKSTVVRLGRPLTAAFSCTYSTAFLFSSSFCHCTPLR